MPPVCRGISTCCSEGSRFFGGRPPSFSPGHSNTQLILLWGRKMEKKCQALSCMSLFSPSHHQQQDRGKRTAGLELGRCCWAPPGHRVGSMWGSPAAHPSWAKPSTGLSLLLEANQRLPSVCPSVHPPTHPSPRHTELSPKARHHGRGHLGGSQEPPHSQGTTSPAATSSQLSGEARTKQELIPSPVCPPALGTGRFSAPRGTGCTRAVVALPNKPFCLRSF